MSSDRLRRLRGNFSIRLSLWYTSIFTISAAALFLLVYFLLASAVERKDREAIDTHLKEYAVIYQSGGVPALRSWIAHSGEASKEKSFFVRIITSARSSLVLAAPEDWIQSEVPVTEFGIPLRVVWLRIPKDEERD